MTNVASGKGELSETVSFKSDWRRHFVDNKEAKRERRDKIKNMQMLFNKCQLQFFQVIICLQYRNKYRTLYFIPRHRRTVRF